MEKLDLKDRKILYELDIDSRQSFRAIGRKVGLHKDVVAYRVKKLQEKGIIKNFITDINHYKLGYTPIKFYFTYQNITPKIKQEIIDYLVKNQYTQEVHSLEGQFDLCIVCTVKDVANFYNTWINIINEYRDFFSNQIFCVQNSSSIYSLTFLLDEKSDKKEERISWMISSNDKKVDIDNLDKKILEFLVSNSRITTIEIAQKLNSTVTTINSRIKKLVKNGVIFGYSVDIDWLKIDYYYYKVDIVLKDSKKTLQIMDYIKNNPNFLLRHVSLGYVDLELIFILNNANQLYHIMEDLSLKFPDLIRNYKYFCTVKTHKLIGADFWNR
jgi:DNA-binding Lrp family transcriptional regulator